jgi:uncharacterized protein (DUF1697 family)
VAAAIAVSYVAFLRAINVRGHAMITMRELCQAFAAAGCRNVSTYIQSGNVLFETAAQDPAALFAKVKARVRTLAGGEPGIMFRSIREIRAVARAAPFAALASDTSIKLYVVFLAEQARARPRLPIVDEKERLELVSLHTGHAFVVSRRKPSGMYGFPNSFVEKALGVAATSRNWNTVTRILARRRETNTAGLKSKTRPTNVALR